MYCLPVVAPDNYCQEGEVAFINVNEASPLPERDFRCRCPGNGLLYLYKEERYGRSKRIKRYFKCDKPSCNVDDLCESRTEIRGIRVWIYHCDCPDGMKQCNDSFYNATFTQKTCTYDPYTGYVYWPFIAIVIYFHVINDKFGSFLYFTRRRKSE